VENSIGGEFYWRRILLVENSIGGEFYWWRILRGKDLQVMLTPQSVIFFSNGTNSAAFHVL
jgi:hypothetical protein